MPAIVEEVSLYNQTGNSDKVYIVNLVEDGASAYRVVAFNGRRGSTLIKREKTKNPVSYAEASQIYNRLINDKKRDGYFEGEQINGLVVSNNGSSATNNPIPTSGLLPQLLNSLDLSEAMEYINDDDFMAQEKKDGVRLMTAKENDAVIGSNKRGVLVSVAKSIHDGLTAVNLNQITLDGEAIGDHYYVFDLLKVNELSTKADSAESRYQKLSGLNLDSEFIHVVETAFTKDEKLALYIRIMDEGGEGLVFKRKSSKYTEGRPNSGGDQFKLKFVESASCVVIGETDGKRSVRFGLYEDDNLVEYGKVTIPPNQEMPHPSDIIEVRYLYAYRNGALFQPVYLGLRHDVIQTECDISQLKFKKEPALAA